MPGNEIILIIGDLHAPCYHQDTISFLSAVKSKHRLTRVILMGDESNGESISYHEHNPDLPGQKDEFDSTIKALKPLYKLFPSADILESNHGSLIYRKAQTAGLPSRAIKSYNDILEAPKTWKWHFDLVVPTKLGPIYFHHGKTSIINKLSQNMSMNACQGHYHAKFYISYWASPVGLFWDANAGTFADAKHLAMAYGRNNIPRGIYGCIIVVNGIPQLIPMVLNKSGRWIGKL